MLSDFAPAKLLAWQLRQAEAAAEAWQTQGHVFTMEDSRPLDTAYLTRLFQALRKGRMRGAAPSSAFHGLTHCYASLMIGSGADICRVSKLLAHASISITAEVYRHLIGRAAPDAGEWGR